MDDFKRAFDAHFSSDGLSMPAECLTTSRGGFEQNGWKIAYRWHTPRGAAPYLDLYASHRMTNDRLYRIHADSEVELVGSVLESCSSDEESKQKFYAHNQAFEAKLRRSGF